jgi:hypothetical protein
MSRYSNILASAFIMVFATITISCDHEDPGPLQKAHKEFAILDFDRLEMGSAFNIEVEQSNTFSVDVRGDRRNIDDLEVFKSGNTLIIQFDDNANRHHDTYIYITMPTLKAVNFSGASVSKIRGFASDDDLDYFLSGASVSQLDADFREINLVVSGASHMSLHGSGDELDGEVSGASSLKAFNYPVREATLNVSGASEAHVTVTDELTITASGASSVLYRGSPSVTSNTSGASHVQKD